MCYRQTVDVWCFKTTETKRGGGNTITVPTVEKVNETVCSLLLTLLWVICRPFEE